jgi:indolepyruvate ferredoxin oxidoreductase
LQERSINTAIELNAVAVDANKAAFSWGRRAALDLEQVQRIALPTKPVVVQMPQSLDTIVRRRAAFLTAYQNAAYAKRYETFVEKVRTAEAKVSTRDALSRAVAHNLFKLMAYKDEYEVARLYTDGEFEKKLKETFEGDFRVKYNLAPPLVAKRDAAGRLTKSQYGPWMRYGFKLLARLKFLRGTRLDIFGRTQERKTERQLIRDYERSLEAALPKLSAETLAQVIELASLPEQIRGYGHIKDASIAKVMPRWRALDETLSISEPAATLPNRAA